VPGTATTIPDRDTAGGAPPHLSLVIPAYNEERRLGPTLARVLDYLQARPYSSEVIVVSDGSRDGTGRVAREAFAAARLAATGGKVRGQFVEYFPNAGKGKAVRTGVLATTGRFVAFTDADLSTPIEEVDRALRSLEGQPPANGITAPGAVRPPDVVIGSRAVAGATVEKYQPLYRRVSAKFFNLLRDGIVGIRGLRDTQCGLKAFDGPAARFIFGRQRIDGFMFDVETMFIAQRLGLTILELGVRWADAPDSKVRLTSGFRLLPDLLRIRFAHQHLNRGSLPDSVRAAGAWAPVTSGR
jgi:glycosyltransferase involved in cell wall biosynthesis